MRKLLLKKKMSDCLSFYSKSNAEIKFAVCTEYIKNLFFFCNIYFKGCLLFGEGPIQTWLQSEVGSIATH